MQNLRNIIVTGSNKGVGYGVIENLAQKAGWNIIMACRNVELANQARNQLLSKFPNAQINVEKLDVSNSDSIKEFVKTIKDKYHTIDVLLNNAGVAAKGDAFDSEIVKWTFATNFYGTIQLSEAILPLIADKGKIIIVGSMIGKVNGRIKNQELKNRLLSQKLTKEQLLDILRAFEKGVAENNYDQLGWPKSIYGASKVGINLYARILSKYPEVVNRQIQVYALCPGYVATDMSSHKGPLTIQEGALTPVYLVQLPFEVNPNLQGQFFQKSALSEL